MVHLFGFATYYIFSLIMTLSWGIAGKTWVSLQFDKVILRQKNQKFLPSHQGSQDRKDPMGYGG